ncbi:acyltransferase [Serratia marcescens]|uniref:acyltransferase family protein n=1 Tax=Serratia marcescens TaxID=615 RepID=UPI001A34C5A2|nr:acyltransferase [Serratia marcescens]HAT5018093.1 acyltransferase [Serratia marcescens]
MRRLELLDYARHLAALMVVLFHYTFNGINNGKVYSIDFLPYIPEMTRYGYLGVDLFFMISGYVIFYSAKNRSAAKFAKSRVFRLYPAYWFAILFTSFFAYFFGGSSMSVSVSQLLVNFTMLQSMFGVGDVDGVYWTLIFELKFYLLIFAILFLGLQKHLDSIIFSWGIIIVAAYFLGMENRVFLGGYYGFFVSGALFAILKDKSSIIKTLLLASLYLINVAYMVNRAEWKPQVTGTVSSTLIISVVIAVFYLFFFIQNTRKFENIKLKGSRLAGALTYPIYLIHAHFGYMMLNKFANNENKVLVYILIILSVYAIALFINLIIERKLSFMWDKIFGLIVEKPISIIQQKFNGLKSLATQNN